MRTLSRLVLAAAVAGGALAAAPAAQANHECVTEPCYDCVRYPCYPSDWIEVLSQGTVTLGHDYVCVNPAAVCVKTPPR